jgi:hypothetical protein
VAPCTACPVYAGYDLPLLTVMWSDVRTSDSSITIPFFIKYDSVMVINQIGAKLYLGENPDFIFDSTQTVVVLQEPDTINFPELLDYGTWGNAERGGPAWYYHYTLVVNGLERNTTYTLGPFVEAAIKGIDKSLPSSHYWDFYEFYSRYFHTFRTK